jgi:YVTN family beta-propeller protein
MQRQPLPLNHARRNLTLALAALWLLCHLGAAPPASAQIIPPSFRNFESPQVHPLALTPDGKRLLAVNSPNATLSVFQLSSGTPVLTAEIPVGLEPVSVAARNDREAWVVNWLSDSVSVVDLSTGNVTRTFDVGDEPTDVLFAGTGREMAFVCVSGASQVKVFDPSDATAPPPQVINVPGKQPRALARSANGAQVFVSVFESGNQTTVVPELTVRFNGGLPTPNPAMAPGLPAAPNTALIVKWNGADWVDEINRSWGGVNTQLSATQRISYTLADTDLLLIDAAGNPPAAIAQARGVGTHIGNMAFDASTGRLFVANLEATNQIRFEPNLSGRFQQSRVSILDVQTAGLSINSTQDLNPHVNPSGPGSDAERAQSLAMPADIVRASDGSVYVAATSSARVGVLSATGVVVSRIGVGQGPTGLALDEARARLYVLNRFDETLSVVDTNTKAQVSQIAVGFNPEPAGVRAGRKILFDANLSSHGTVSCASCHPNGHRDGLAWDLGNPQGTLDSAQGASFHPMKGPMTTQSLRGINGTEPLHWRGDRANLAAFNPAFVSLLGGARQLNPQELSDFTAFVQSLTYPPNPNENLDRTLSAQAQRGFNAFNTQRVDLGALTCNNCHTLFPFSNAGGAFVTGTGTSRAIIPAILLGETQDFKIPQLRGLYQKTGMDKTPGEKLTGFGFIHDGANDNIFDFLKNNAVFTFPAGQAGDDMRRDIEAFLLQLDTGPAPAVGLQVTINASNKNEQTTLDRVNLLVQQTAAGNCELIVRGLYGGAPRAFQRLQNGTFQPDSLSEAPVALQALLTAAGAGSELTFTGVLPGTGRRMSIDTDNDGVLNDDEPRASVSINGRVVDASGQGISGVVVTLSGTQAAATETDSFGRYSFNYVSTVGTHTVTPQTVGLPFSPASRTFSNPTWNQSATFITSPNANASDSSQFFVSQHYQDFLNREADASGLQFWTGEIEGCGANAQCREVKRNNVSAAFFLSIEFQQTGYLVYKTNKASFGSLPGKPAPVAFQQLMTDTQRVGRGVVVGSGNWQTQLETNKQAFFLGWVQRPEFLARYPATLSALDFVNALNANTGGSLTTTERDALAAQLASNNTTQGRAAAVRQMAENAEFTRREVNRAFVLMQYFGYLRRNPDAAPDEDFAGYQFWLQKLEEFQGNYITAEMVKAFISSIEYRKRFGQP